MKSFTFGTRFLSCSVGCASPIKPASARIRAILMCKSRLVYTRLEEMGIEAYIKPVNYEISKTKKYQRDRYKAENMPYDEETDSFICPNGNTLTAIGTAHRKSKSGFLSEVTLYRCTECRNCPLKAECTKSKNGRTIQRSKVLQRQREQSRERITSELGIQLRVNRSIQSEGTFGVLKQD